MLDVSLPFEERSTKWTKTTKNVKNGGRPNTFFCLLATSVTSTHSCKIVRVCFKIFKTLRNIPRIYPNIPHNVSSRYKLWNFSQLIDCQSNIKNICVKFHKKRCRTTLKNRKAYSKTSHKIPQIAHSREGDVMMRFF